MKEIIIDSNILTHNKYRSTDRYDGVGNKKSDEELFTIITNPESKKSVEYIQLISEGKVKIQSTLDVNAYADFLDEAYNKLKFKRKLKNNLELPTASIFLYDFDSSLLDKTVFEELDIREQRIRKMRMGIGPSDNSGLSDKNSNKSLFKIFYENDEILFRKAYPTSPILQAGSLHIKSFAGKDISHINLKELPFILKKDISLHSCLNKQTLKKEFIEAQIFHLYNLADLHSWVYDFSHAKSCWDENDEEFREYIREATKLIPEIHKIHGGSDHPALPHYTVQELNYRMTVDSINDTHVLMEVYFKSADALREEEIQTLSEQELVSLENYKKESKKIEDLFPLFPLTFLIQKTEVKKIKENFSNFFDSKKEGLSYFE